MRISSNLFRSKSILYCKREAVSRIYIIGIDYVYDILCIHSFPKQRKTKLCIDAYGTSLTKCNIDHAAGPSFHPSILPCSHQIACCVETQFSIIIPDMKKRKMLSNPWLRAEFNPRQKSLVVYLDPFHVTRICSPTVILIPNPIH
jgi:hypothetical protein